MTQQIHPTSDDTDSRTQFVLDRLGSHRLLAVLRGSDAERVAAAGATLVEAGVEILEVTFTVPDCASAIRHLKDTQPSALIGAGTVTNSTELQQAVDAGADFIVTPGATAALLRELAQSGLPFLPGVLTPSEVLAALEAGAPGVKFFPGSFTGPSGIRALRGPFPDLRVVPTGGVSPHNVSTWLDAGAFAVGAGSDLAPPAAVDSGDHDLLRSRAQAWLHALHRTTES